MLELFHKGGPIMWPLLAASLMGMTVVIERLFFIIRETRSSNPELRKKILFSVESGNVDRAQNMGEQSKDFVVKILMEGLRQKESLSMALMNAASVQLKRYSKGVTILDTIITLAPLLGLLGTVTGMVRAFGLLGGSELDAPTAITGGIAEALIATAFGLGIAILCLIPFNWLNACAEHAKYEMELASTELEMVMKEREKEFYETSANLR